MEELVAQGNASNRKESAPGAPGVTEWVVERENNGGAGSDSSSLYMHIMEKLSNSETLPPYYRVKAQQLIIQIGHFPFFLERSPHALSTGLHRFYYLQA